MYGVDGVDQGVDGVDGEVEERMDGVDWVDSALVGGDFTWVLGVEFVGVGAGSLGAGEGHLDELDVSMLVKPGLISVVTDLELAGVTMLVRQDLSVGLATRVLEVNGVGGSE